MNERARSDDRLELGYLAYDVICRALGDGDEKHPPGSWMNESRSEQRAHAQAHFEAFMASDAETDREHLICRLIMDKALKQRAEPPA